MEDPKQIMRDPQLVEKKMDRKNLQSLIVSTGIFVIIALLQILSPKLPVISKVRLGRGTIGDWVALILVPVLLVLIVQILLAGKRALSSYLGRFISSGKMAALRPFVPGLIASFLGILLLMVAYFFLHGATTNYILASNRLIGKIVDVVVALAGIGLLGYLVYFLFKILKTLSATITGDFDG